LLGDITLQSDPNLTQFAVAANPGKDQIDSALTLPFHLSLPERAAPPEFGHHCLK
jgi:hypothetical protein